MQSIVTITLNPAIDKSSSTRQLEPEKKLSCSSPVFEPGGGGVNVARAIHQLGGQTTALYFAGGYTGQFFTQLLEVEGIPIKPINIGAPTRENLIIFEESSQLQYRFGMPGPNIEPGEWQELLHQVECMNHNGFIVASGSIPPGIPLDIFGRIAAIAKKKSAKFIVDTSGEALRHAADEGVYLLKPNLGELSALTGLTLNGLDRIRDAARSIISKGHCEVLVVSMGPEGALLVTASEDHHIQPPAVKRVSTVGAGDSMVAGIVYQLAHDQSLMHAAKYGVACGTAATLNPGTELCRKADADRLFSLL